MSLERTPRCILILVAVFLIGAGGGTRADFCVMCDDNFWCVGAGRGAELCRAAENLCYIIGQCPSSPPPPPPEPDPGPIAATFEYYFAVSFQANLGGFPVNLPLEAGDDANELRLEISTRAGIEQSEVVLKGGMFSVASLPVEPGKYATAAHTTGSLFRINPLEDEWCRARICSGTIGGQPQLKADVELPPEGGIVLVPFTVKNDKVVVAYRITVIPAEEFEGDPIGPQYSFREDLKDNMGPDPYVMSVGEMSDTCH